MDEFEKFIAELPPEERQAFLSHQAEMRKALRKFVIADGAQIVREIDLSAARPIAEIKSKLVKTGLYVSWATCPDGIDERITDENMPTKGARHT